MNRFTETSRQGWFYINKVVVENMEVDCPGLITDSDTYPVGCFFILSILQGFFLNIYFY